MAGHRVVRAVIRGRVQGVGYRAWTQGQAELRGLSGWVRNRRDGSVETVLAGDSETVEAMLAALREGPHGARVDAVETEDAGPGALALRPEASGFVVLRTM